MALYVAWRTIGASSVRRRRKNPAEQEGNRSRTVKAIRASRTTPEVAPDESHHVDQGEEDRPPKTMAARAPAVRAPAVVVKPRKKSSSRGGDDAAARRFMPRPPASRATGSSAPGSRQGAPPGRRRGTCRRRGRDRQGHPQATSPATEPSPGAAGGAHLPPGERARRDDDEAHEADRQDGRDGDGDDDGGRAVRTMSRAPMRSWPQGENERRGEDDGREGPAKSAPSARRWSACDPAPAVRRGRSGDAEDEGEGGARPAPAGHEDEGGPSPATARAHAAR